MKFSDLTGKIEGYNEMSVEDKLKAIEALELEDTEALKQDNLKLKNANNKISSEVAEYKRQLKEKMSEDEKKEAERKEKQEAMESELNTLRKEKTILEYVGMGYTPELANEMVEAIASGSLTEIAKVQNKFLEAEKAKWEKESLDKHPDLSKDKDKKKPLTKEDIMAIKDPIERQKAIANNIELFD